MEERELKMQITNFNNLVKSSANYDEQSTIKSTVFSFHDEFYCSTPELFDKNDNFCIIDAEFEESLLKSAYFYLPPSTNKANVCMYVKKTQIL